MTSTEAPKQPNLRGPAVRPTRLRAVWPAFVVLFFPLVASRADGASFQGFRPVDIGWQPDRKAKIVWKDTMEATHKENYTIWQKEINAKERHRHNRTYKLAMRMLFLYEETLKKYPKDKKRRIEAYRQIAYNYAVIRRNGRGNYFLKKLVDEFPNENAKVIEALHEILKRVPWHEPWRLEEGNSWVEYAVERILKMERQGRVKREHAAVGDAMKALVILRRRQGRLQEAYEALLKMKAGKEKDVWWNLEYASLLGDVGHGEKAVSVLKKLQQSMAKKDNRHYKVRDRKNRLQSGLFARQALFPRWDGGIKPWENVIGDAAGSGRNGLDQPGERRRLNAESTTVFKALAEADEGAHTIPWLEGVNPSIENVRRFTSIWSAIDRFLLDQEPEILRELRAESDKKSGAYLATTSLNDNEVLRAYRRFPLGHPVHLAMLRRGVDALRDGRADTAIRFFEDVSAHTTKPELRKRAQIGRLLALLQQGQRDSVLDAASQLNASESYPWQGGTLDGAAIGKWFSKATVALNKGNGPTGLSKINRVVLKRPVAALWPPEAHESLLSHVAVTFFQSTPDVSRVDGATIVSGPNGLLFYEGAATAPTWQRLVPRAQVNVNPGSGVYYRTGIVPGHFRPAIMHDRIVSRWGMNQHRQYMKHVAAFSRKDGHMLWTTHGRSALKGSLPASDPVVSEGRVYLMTLGGGLNSPIYLACLDSDTGKLLWRRELASQMIGLTMASDSGFSGMDADVVRFGNRVTVHEGSIYCSTAMGCVARCDARDGVIEWARAYPRARLGSNRNRIIQREGAAPVVSGNCVIFMPRDADGVFALDRDTGSVVWEQPFLPSLKSSGSVNGTLVVSDHQRIAGVNTRTGDVRWVNALPKPLLCNPVLSGDSVYAGTADTMYRLSVTDGRAREKGGWGLKSPMCAFTVEGHRLIGISSGQETLTSLPAEQKLSVLKQAKPDKYEPLCQKRWSLIRPHPKVWTPPQQAGLKGYHYLQSSGVLECLQFRPDGATTVWTRLTRPGFKDLYWTAGRMFIIHLNSVENLDPKTGKTIWRSRIPLHARAWRTCGEHLIFGSFTGSKPDRWICAFRLKDGQLAWKRGFYEWGHDWGTHFRDLGWDGKHLRVPGPTRRYGSWYDLHIDPATGQLTKCVGPLMKGKPCQTVVNGGNRTYIILVGDPKKAPAKDPGIKHLIENPIFKGFTSHPLFRQTAAKAHRFTFNGHWMTMTATKGRNKGNDNWVLRRGDKGWVHQYGSSTPQFHGNRLYWFSGSSLYALDYPTKKPIKYDVPYKGRGWGIAFRTFWIQGNTLWLLTGQGKWGGSQGWSSSDRLSVHTFDLKTTKRRTSQELRDVPSWVARRSESNHWHSWRYASLIRCPGVMVFTGPNGIHGYTLTQKPSTELQTVNIKHTDTKVLTDGRLTEWKDARVVTLHGPANPPAQLLLLQKDSTEMCMAVRQPVSNVYPWLGDRSYGGGHWVEFALCTNAATRRWGMGCDASGKRMIKTLDRYGAPPGMQYAIEYDRERKEIIYEMKWPLRGLYSTRSNWRIMGLSVAAHDETPNGGKRWGSMFGGALRSPVFLSQMNGRIHLLERPKPPPKPDVKTKGKGKDKSKKKRKK